MNLFQHYKGDIYNVLTFNAKDENGDMFAVYAPLYHGAEADLFIQPVRQFYESVMDSTGQRVPRFKPIDMKEFLRK